jgi:hypothetical protein
MPWLSVQVDGHWLYLLLPRLHDRPSSLDHQHHVNIHHFHLINHLHLHLNLRHVI